MILSNPSSPLGLVQYNPVCPHIVLCDPICHLGPLQFIIILSVLLVLHTIVYMVCTYTVLFLCPVDPV
jgi:hypothetical protein